MNEGRGDIYLLEGRFCGEVSAAAAVAVTHQQLDEAGTGCVLPRPVAGAHLQREPWFDFSVAWTRAVAEAHDWTVELSFRSGGGCGVRAQFWRLCDVMRRDVARLGRRWNRVRQKQQGCRKKKRKLHELASATDN